MQSLARCHLFLEEREVALNLIEYGLTKIEKAGVSVAYMRSRLAPKVNGSFPEESWRQFIEYRKSFNSNHIANLIQPKENIVEIEIKPCELIGVSNAKV